nr:hypothetical protein OH837_34000 [Streptomyces canus]
MARPPDPDRPHGNAPPRRTTALAEPLGQLAAAILVVAVASGQ